MIVYLMCLLNVITLLKCQNVTHPTNLSEKEELDWNLYELEKQQVLDYNNLEDHKDDILKELDYLEKRAKSEADLEDQFLYLYHNILKRESFIKRENYSRRRKKRAPRERDVIREQTIDGGWSPWSYVATPCNATCGGGKMLRRRSCTNPTPQVRYFNMNFLILIIFDLFIQSIILIHWCMINALYMDIGISSKNVCWKISHVF